jgi:hypothetical protein
MTVNEGLIGVSAAILLSNSFAVFGASGPAVPDVKEYGAALTKFVREDGRVDYAGIKAAGALDGFVKQLSSVSPDSHPALFPSREARLAYWINAYNALVLHAFSQEYPERRDRLKGMFGRGLFFYGRKHLVGGRKRSLADIEDHSIRNMGDPRIHFAIVCASTSCPALSRIPYTPETLDRHLEAETLKYFSESRNFAMDTTVREVRLPQIMEWFMADFGTTQAKVLEFIARYRPAEAKYLRTGGWKIKYFEYDWSANDVRP